MRSGSIRIRWGRDDSGVAGGQVEATKYVEFRNVTTSFFSRYVSNFHEKHQISANSVRYLRTPDHSIAYEAWRKQALHKRSQANSAILKKFSNMIRVCLRYVGDCSIRWRSSRSGASGPRTFIISWRVSGCWRH